MLYEPQVIADITRRMGEGMAEFISKEVVTVADYDRCWAQCLSRRYFTLAAVPSCRACHHLSMHC